MLKMVNFTREDLFVRIRQDNGKDGNPNSPNFVELAQEAFFNLLGIDRNSAEGKLQGEVKKTCEDFAYYLKRKWNMKKVGRHLDKLKKYHQDFLSQYFQISSIDNPGAEVEEQIEDDVEEPMDVEIIQPQITPIPTTSNAITETEETEPVENIPFNQKVHFSNSYFLDLIRIFVNAKT